MNSAQQSIKLLVSAFDLGQKGMAMCTADIGGKIPVIKRLELLDDVGKINTPESAAAAVTHMVRDAAFPNVDMYIIEQQPAINRRTCMLESALAAALAFRKPNARVMHMSPKMVKRHFGLPSGYSQKKRAASRLTSSMIRSPKVAIERGKILENFESSSRKHDMADAFLMVMMSHHASRKIIDPQPRRKKQHRDS